MKRHNRLLLLAGALYILGISEYGHCSPPTGYDVVTLNTPDEGQVNYLAGCTTYVEPGNELVFYCQQDIVEQPALAITDPGEPIIFGAVVDNWTYWPSQHVCRLINKTEYSDYTGYTFQCGTPIFAANFEVNNE